VHTLRGFPATPRVRATHSRATGSRKIESIATLRERSDAQPAPPSYAVRASDSRPIGWHNWADRPSPEPASHPGFETPPEMLRKRAPSSQSMHPAPIELLARALFLRPSGLRTTPAPAPDPAPISENETAAESRRSRPAREARRSSPPRAHLPIHRVASPAAPHPDTRRPGLAPPQYPTPYTPSPRARSGPNAPATPRRWPPASSAQPLLPRRSPHAHTRLDPLFAPPQLPHWPGSAESQAPPPFPAARSSRP